MRKLLLCYVVFCVASRKSFSFGAAGDYASGPRFLATMDAVRKSQVDFQLALGDLAYSADKEAWWCQQWINRSIDVMLIAGNHDSGENCCGILDHYLATCPRPFEVVGDYGIRYYFDYPPEKPLARFIMITPGVVGTIAAYNTYQAGGEGLIWLQTALKDARQRNIQWLFVGMHKVFVSAMEKMNEVGEALMSSLFFYKVDMILQAHEHGYERSKQLQCASPGLFHQECVSDTDHSFAQNGTVIVILGTGGMDLRDSTADSETGYFSVLDTKTYGFGHFVVSAESLNYTFKPVQGNLTDYFVIHAQHSRNFQEQHGAPLASATPTTPPPTPLQLARAAKDSPNLLIAILVPICSVFLACLLGFLYYRFKKSKYYNKKPESTPTEAEPLASPEKVGEGKAEAA